MSATEPSLALLPPSAAHDVLAANVNTDAFAGHPGWLGLRLDQPPVPSYRDGAEPGFAVADLVVGEDPVAAAERFIDCLSDVCRAHPDGRVLVVAHTTVIRLALCSLIGIPLKEYRRLFPAVRNCALTELLRVDGRTAVLEFNTPVTRFAAVPMPLTRTASLEESA